MKLLYVFPVLFATVCLACPGTDSMTAEERAKAKSPHGLPADFKFRFVDEKTEAEYYEKRAKRKLSESDKKTQSQDITYAYCDMTNGAAPVRSAANTCAAYNIVQPYFQSAIDNLNGDVYWLSTVYGALVRLAFHDAAEVDITATDSYGPDGCLSYDDGHAGLVDSNSLISYAVEPLYQQVCDKITRADLWVMLGKLALMSAEPTGSMTIDYQYGRVDATSVGCSVTGRLPTSEGTVDEMYRVFVTQMGMDLNDAATLLGAHSVGHMHTYYSGYGTFNDLSDGYANGFDDTPHIFDNNYYYNMLINTWTSQTAPASSSLSQFQMSGNTNMVLLPADISVGYIRTSYSSFIAQSCGPYAVATGSTTTTTASGTKTSTVYGYGCTPSSTVMPLTCWQSCNHGNSNSYFLAQFRSSWNKMVCAGYGVPAATTGASASGKLGTLYYLDLDTC